MPSKTVLVTGATGYIGGRLVPELLAAGHRVRCLARTPAKLADRPWHGEVEVVAGDAGSADDVGAAMEGVDAAYYLIHSMDGDGDFVERDRRLAETFRDAAADAGVGLIVYLGGLGHEDGDEELSPHLKSRHEVGRVLADGPVAVTEFRAAVIIGSGSASFEMLRHLVEVLPAMVTPRWVRTRCQPIAIRDILAYLVRVLDVPDAHGQVLQVGGPDVLTYRDMMRTYAQVAGLRPRLVVPVPVLTPSLSSHWVGLVTPMPAGLARPLVQSLSSEVVVTDRRVEGLMPRDCLTFREACEKAIRRVDDLEVTTNWAGAHGVSGPADPWPEDPDWSGGTVFADERSAVSSAPPDVLFEEVRSIGGARGYPAGNFLWGVRGLLDVVVGGVGLRRGRRHPTELRVGDAVDFWRVEAVHEPELLRLRAEMRVPGDAWLEFRVAPRGSGSELIQRARFHPRGLWGRVYWALMLPFHRFIFPGMAQRIAAAATARATAGAPRAPRRAS